MAVAEPQVLQTHGLSFVSEAQAAGDMRLDITAGAGLQDSVHAVLPDTPLGSGGLLGTLNGTITDVDAAQRTGTFRVCGQYIGPFRLSEPFQLQFVFQFSLE